MTPKGIMEDLTDGDSSSLLEARTELAARIRAFIDPMRAADFSPMLGSAAHAVCRMLLLYRKPVFCEEQECIRFVALNATDYDTVDDLLEEEVVKIEVDGREVLAKGELELSIAFPEKLNLEITPTDVRSEFYRQAPAKRFIETSLDIRQPDWLDALCEHDPSFRFWWHSVNYELIEDLRAMPLSSAMAWQAMTARRIIVAERADTEHCVRGRYLAWWQARKDAGEDLISWVECQHGEGQHYTSENAATLFDSLAGMAATAGNERIGAALLHARISADDDVRTEAGRRYPYPPLAALMKRNCDDCPLGEGS